MEIVSTVVSLRTPAITYVAENDDRDKGQRFGPNPV